jgi:formate hydrogenlyase transcriptional activator
VFAEELRQVVSFDYLDVVLFKENSPSVLWRWRLGFGDADVGEPALALGEATTTGWVYSHQQALVVADWQRETAFPTSRTSLDGIGIRSTCTLPMTTMHRRFGTFEVGSFAPGAYPEEEVQFLSLVAGQIALTVDAALSFKTSQQAQSELEKRNQQLQLLLELTTQIVSNLELREVLRAIVGSVRRVMRCDTVGISLLEPNGDKLQSYVLDFPGSKGFMKEGTPIPIETSLPGTVVRSRKPLVSQADLVEQFPCSVIAAEGLKSGCLLPIISRDRVLGVLGLARFEPTPFAPDEVDFLVQVANQVAMAVENALAYSEIGELKDKLAQEKLYLEEEIRGEMDFEGIVGQSSGLRRVLQLVETVAPSDSTVLLLGETGTGKELIARAVHDRSRRRDRTFVKLNCAAIPTGLLESELFGHEKGAFTGAINQKTGRLELANQGTLFLDEVGDIPLEIQPKLLRALQEREFERLGGNRTHKVDVRLVAATNRDLDKMIVDRQFRSDLYYRLNVFPIVIPPLRERPEDIALLVRYFAQKYAQRMQKKIESIPAAAIRKLTEWSWPGNIRELENFIERAVILTRGSVLEVPISELNGRGAAPAPGTRQHAERDALLQILKETKGRVGGADGAAARMGLKRTTFISRMKKLGIDARDVF